MTRLLAWALLCCALMGCGGDGANFIHGALTASYDMDFDTVRIRLFTSEVAIEYVRNPGASEELPLKLTASFAEAPIEAGTPIDLRPPSGTITRVTTDTARLPELSDRPSNITFDDWSTEAGATISGTFRADFDNGTALNGGFEADLERPLDQL